jgi:hypothetical protein
MTTYADPTRCPDCRSPLPEAPQNCPQCGVPLTGPTAVELFTTLQHADRLLAALRREISEAPRPVAVGVGSPSAEGSLLVDATPYPAADRHRTERGRDRVGSPLTGASVPKILLTLGALCLLVAAVIFLAVAWAWLGVGGRTTVLLVLTVGALGGATASTGRGLRMAGEALTVVGLGLVALDVVGARHAGWLGPISDAGLATTGGAVVATVALLMLLVTVPRPLVGPALVAPSAVLVAGIGAQVPVDAPVPMLVATLALLALGRLGVAVRSAPLRVSSVVTATLAWFYVLVSGVGRTVSEPTVEHLWGHGAVWPLAAAAAVAAVAAPAVGLGRTATRAGCSVAGLVATYVVVAPALDSSPTAATLSLLPCVLVWAAAAILAPASWRPVAVLPLVGAVALPFVVLVDLAGTAFRATLQVGAPFTQPLGVHVAASSPWVSPWLAAPTLVVLAVAGGALVSLVSPLRRTGWFVTLAGATAVGALITLPLYDVPLAGVVGALMVLSAAGLVAAERLDGVVAGSVRCLAGLGGLLAVAAALPSDVLATLALAVSTAVSLHLTRRSDLTGRVATAAFAVAFGGLVWACGEVLSVPESERALPILLVLGALAIRRPEPVLEISAAAVGSVASVAAVAAAVDPAWALAVHLTVAGALVTASALVHHTRRFLAWPGGVLLALATWVRLSELGVTVPEAYTLPSALVLTGVGIWRLRHEDEGATMRLLGPGLSLATVPSLVAVLDDPASLRALLLGVACLALVLAGAALRWGAPLVVGSVVGALLVLRELAPYAAALPPWVVIGVSGGLLLTVGVTWESRMRDLHTAHRYVAALR